MGVMVVGASRATSLRSGGVMLSEAWSPALGAGLIPSVTA